MSARQPFVPLARSPSVQSTGTPGSALNDVKTKLSTNRQDSHDSGSVADSEELSFTTSIHKPLNISNLTNKMHANADKLNSKPRHSFGDELSRPMSPVAKPFKPSAPHRQSKIVAASPFFPSTASFQAVSSFRTPRVPSPTKRHSAASIEDLSSNQTHTFAAGPLLLDDRSIRSDDLPRTSANQASTEQDAQDLPDERYEDGSEKIGQSQLASYTDGTDDDKVDRYTKIPLRRVGKRTQRAEDNEMGLEYNSVKRYRMDDERDMQSNYASCRATPLSHYASDNSPQRSLSPLDPQPPSVYASMEGGPRPPVNARSDHALYRLFGHDLDIYTDAHLDALEQAKRKWTDCTIDEWKAGAGEVAGKFATLLDFVKDHMSSKLCLYASFDEELVKHREILEGRRSTLENVRNTLIRNGGNVVQIKGPSEYTRADKSNTKPGLEATDEV